MVKGVKDVKPKAEGKANLYPVRLYKEEVVYIEYLSQVSGDTRGEVLRNIIRQHKKDAEANGKVKNIHAVSDDGLFEFTVVRRERR